MSEMAEAIRALVDEKGYSEEAVKQIRLDRQLKEH